MATHIELLDTVAVTEDIPTLAHVWGEEARAGRSRAQKRLVFQALPSEWPLAP